MKHELVQARDATGMQLRGQNSMLCGYYRGYAMMTTMNSKNRCYDVAVWASRPGEDMTSQVNQWLTGYAAGHPACLGGNYQMNRLLVVHIAMDKRPQVPVQSPEELQKTVNDLLETGSTVTVRERARVTVRNRRDVIAQDLVAFYKEVSAFLSANGMVTVCDRCGRPEDTALYHISPGYNVICPQCLAEVGQFHRERQQAIPGNLPAGVVGAFLFSFIGVALWVLINRLGYVAAICGLVMMVCAFKGYEKFGKKLDVPGIVVSILVVVFMGLVSQYLCVGLDIYEAFADYGVTLMEAMRAVPAFLFDPELDLMSAYLPDLLMGYAFMALGSFSVVRNAIVAQRSGGTGAEMIARGPAAPATVPTPGSAPAQTSRPDPGKDDGDFPMNNYFS